MRSCAAALAAVALCAACKKREAAPPPPAVPAVAALAAIPSDATVVVGLDVRALADSDLVGRALRQMFISDPGLTGRFERLAGDCGVDVARQIEHVHLAMAPGGLGPARRAILVATGRLDEEALARCLQAGVGAGGGDLSVKQAGVRSIYKLVEGRHTVYFGFGQADTVVVGPDETWVEAALADGPKVATGGLARLLTAVDQTSDLWFVAQMDPELGASLVRTTGGAIAAPPRGVLAELDPRAGLVAHAAFTMESDTDANQLAEFARRELAVGAMAAQLYGLGPAVAKIAVAAQGPEVHFRVRLTDAELKDVLTAIDRAGGGGQDAPPLADGGLPLTPDGSPSQPGSP